jgi:peptidoglycan/xylan/chitin deacetylase (PgdA/CDA1 family)
MGWASLIASGVLLYYLKPVLRAGVQPGVRELIRTHWDYGRWSMLGTVVMWLEVNSYYLTTGTFLGMREAGALAALASFALPINHIFQGTSRLLLPVFSKHATERGYEATRQLAGRLSMVFIAAVGVYAVMASVFGRLAITLLYGPRFTEFSRYVGPSLISVVLSSAIVPKEIAMRAIKAPRQLLRASVCTGSLALVVGLTAIWTLGLPGVFLSTALTTLFHFCLVSFLLRRETRTGSSAKGARLLPVIAYHHVGPARPGILRSLTLSGRRFATQMAWLSRFGYRTVTEHEVLAWMRGEQELPRKAVMITFDDAYEDLCKHALPVLAQHKFHSMVFVVTGEIGGSNHFDQRTGCGPLRLMAADQIREWAARGVEFGAHSRSHFDLTTAKGLELVDEVEGSRTDLESLLNQPVLSFAYPYGAFDSAVEKQAAKRYQLVFTTRSGLNEQGTPAFRISRSVTHHRDTALDILLRVTLGWSPVEVVREYVMRPLRPLFTPFRTPYLRGDTQDA